MNTLNKAAYALGQQAWAQGLNSIPHSNKALFEMLPNGPMGDTKNHKIRMNAMKAYSRGWATASLAD